MSEKYVEQPLPVANDYPHIHDLVADDLMGRKKLGIERYGQPLQPFNGRKSPQDAYEEMLDFLCYFKQMILEYGNLAPRRPQLIDYVNLRQHLVREHGMGVTDAAVLEKTQVIQAHLDDHRTNGLAHQYHPWGESA